MTERKKKKQKKKKGAEFIPRAFPSESPSNKSLTGLEVELKDDLFTNALLLLRV